MLRMHQEELFRYLNDESRLCFLVDQEDRIHYVSEASVGRWLGYAWDELNGKPISEIVPSCRSVELFRNHGDTRCVLKTKDGRSLTASFATMEVWDGECQLRLVEFYSLHPFGCLEMLNPFAHSFMHDVNLGVLLINENYELADISDMACKVLAVNRYDVLGASVDVLFAHVPEEHRFIGRSLLDGVIVKNHAISWRNDEAKYDLIMDSSVLYDADGNKTGAYVIFKDVSNLRSLEEQVQRNDRLAMIGQIAAGTAHEIRNPLTSIKGFLQVLNRTFAEHRFHKEQGYTEIMLSEIDRINELVSEFLLLSKQRNIVYAPISIHAVIRDILPIINNEALLHGVSVHYQTSGHSRELIGDRELLKQVFLNLCKNGIEAMAGEGRLTITERVDEVQEYVIVDIHDTGPGIPSYLIDKIFDPFFTTKEEGTGLGLSVCQRIVHDMGGTVRVASKGFGTTFTISLPFQKRGNYVV